MSSKRVVLRFPRGLVERPLVCECVKGHDLDFNILRANVTPDEEGLLVLEFEGVERDLEQGIEYLVRAGVAVEPLSQDVTRNEDRCTHCGACVVLCPSGALATEPGSGKISFDAERCIACEICVRACPPRAMRVRFPAFHQ